MTGIVDIRFCFNNYDVLNLLEKRSNALLNLKHSKVSNYERRLDNKIRKSFDEIRTPNTFYCTFEHSQTAKALLDIKKL